LINHKFRENHLNCLVDTHSLRRIIINVLGYMTKSERVKRKNLIKQSKKREKKINIGDNKLASKYTVKILHAESA